MSSQVLKCRRTEKEKEKEKRNTKEKKENKNIASVHQMFAILFPGPTLERGRERIRRGPLASSNGRTELPGLWSVGATLEAWIEEGA